MMDFLRCRKWQFLVILIVTLVVANIALQSIVLSLTQRQVSIIKGEDEIHRIAALDENKEKSYALGKEIESSDNDNNNEKIDDLNHRDDRTMNNATTSVNNKGIKQIRKWGCDRTETPLIFVHNGKMGGGNVRVRLAASAMDVDRLQILHQPESDNHYYPIRNSSSDSNSVNNKSADTNGSSNHREGKFCDAKYPRYVMVGEEDLPKNPRLQMRQFCNATTPFGIAIACPHPYKKSENAMAADKARALNRFERNHSIRGARKRKKEAMKLHYKSLNCRNCDDDHYLDDLDHYFDTISESSIFNPPSDPHPGHTCDIVYTGHNNIGSELHWLPPRYLKEHWWDNSVFGRHGNGNGGDSGSDELDQYWATLLEDRNRRRQQLFRKLTKEAGTASINLDHDTAADEEEYTSTATRWCPRGYFPESQEGEVYTAGGKRYDRPATEEDYTGAFKTCSIPLAEKADRLFLESFYPPSSSTTDGKQQKLNYSPFYASMPVHRVTLLRDPWSWIVSKFFWHRRKNDSRSCEDFTFSLGTKYKDPISGRLMEWCEIYSLESLFKLCGNDCPLRYKYGMMSLEEIEDQVESNLRNAFSVVGLLIEIETFYDMVTDRIDYVDLTRSIELSGNDHATNKTEEHIACKLLYQDDEIFRESVRQKVPAFAALERIYHVGVEVNRFQQQELEQCRKSKGGTPTKGVYSLTKDHETGEKNTKKASFRKGTSNG